MAITIIDGESLYWGVKRVWSMLYRERKPLDYATFGQILIDERTKLGWKAGEFHYLLKNVGDVERFAKYLEKTGYVVSLLNMSSQDCLTPALAYILGRIREQDEILVISHDNNILPILSDLQDRGKQVAVGSLTYRQSFLFPYVDLAQSKYLQSLFGEEIRQNQGMNLVGI